jgi:signal recognition particle subunit SRP54
MQKGVPGMGTGAGLPPLPPGLAGKGPPLPGFPGLGGPKLPGGLPGLGGSPFGGKKK